jgi:glycosyltransferase involved in cell wall biosynthesis
MPSAARGREVSQITELFELRPRRVLYFNSWSTAHGGSSTSLLDIVRALDRRRFEPLVVCPGPGELPTRLSEIGVPVVTHPLSRLNREEAWKFLREVPWYLGLLHREQVSLVHGNTSSSRRSLLQATAIARLPYVQHIRNGTGRPRLAMGCRYAARVVVNSNDAGRALYADPTLAPKTVTIHNAVDLSAYDGREDRRTELGAGTRPLIGFVGQIVPRKGVTTLLRAMRSVIDRRPDVWLVVVGCAPPDDGTYEAECRSLAGQLGISANVHFVGYRRDVPAWMRTFDVFALPTRSEPFGKVVIEAMAAGAPVVASRVGGIPEIVTRPELGTLIDPDDDNALARAILEFLENRPRALAVAEAGRRHARSHFGLEGMIERLQDLYEQILNTRRRSRAA